MTLINISLCLPELDIVALRQKHSIVVVTQRFIVPDRSFALLPCRSLSASSQLLDLYHPNVLAELQSAALPATEPMKATHWAQCVFCQQVSEEAITTLSELTIWTKQSLSDQLREGRLFLSFLRTYALPEYFLVEPELVCDQLYKFLPLPNYIEVDEKSPSYSGDEFAAAKKAILEPESSELSALPREEPIEKAEPPKLENILESEDWVTKISEVGNSSDGHTFEKLVRKGLIVLGFSNSLSSSKVSLDPEATGGAGGLDFYADKPYPIVGECKATAFGASRSVGDPVSQLHRLGIRWLSKENFDLSVKLIFAAGRIADPANKTAIEHGMNVIRPETLQALVALKLKYGNSLRLSDMMSDFKERLQRPFFGTDADAKISSLVQQWEAVFKEEAERLQRGRQIVQTVKELSEQPIHKERRDFSVVEIRAHHNAKYQPCITDQATEDMLKELSSLYSAGYLGQKRILDGQEYFYFRKDMPQADS